MSKFEELAKAAAAPNAPPAPKGAPLDVSEALGGRKTAEPILPEEAFQATQAMPMTEEAREALRGRLSEALTLFALTAPIPNAEAIPFLPDSESRAVRERIEQGPRVFRSTAERDAKAKEPMPLTAPISKGRPTIAHPDMSKPGRTLKGESPPYRPA